MTIDHEALEALTRDYGREIFARVGVQGPVPFSPLWWDERLMESSMGDAAVKTQLFRFVDALPRLHTPSEIVRHLREYFSEAADHIPPWLRWLVRCLPERGVAGRMLAATAYLSAERLARRFIAGANVDEALDTIYQMRQRSLAFTIDLLGEATITEAESDRYQEEYFRLIEGLGTEARTWKTINLIDGDERGALPRVNVSIKLSSLFSQFDPIDPVGTSRAVLARLRPILRHARAHQVFVNVDMEQYAFKDTTLQIFRDVFTEDEFCDWPDVGIAIQAYLRDTSGDLERLARWVEHRGVPVWVRLVKGAYWDYETVVAGQQGWPIPVFTRKAETDAQYERSARFLLEHRELLRPAFGSHNIRNLAYVLASARMLGVPERAYEIQMLYGMADPVKDALVGLGRRVRVYTPFGKLLPGMAYLVRRLLENTANESFLRASFTEHLPEEQLLMNPETKIATPSPIESLAPTKTRFQNEALADFSKEEVRQTMRQSLEAVATQLGRTYPPVIDNRTVATAATFDSLDPSHSAQVVGRCGLSTVVHVGQAVAAACAAFPSWRGAEPRRRAEYLLQVARVLRRRRFELAAWEIRECGKPWREADADVAESIDFCTYYAREMLRLTEPQRRDVPGEHNETFYEPRGVTVVIAPWNFPLAILCGMTAAALVTGNPVIFKPAEQASVIGAKLMEIFQEAGLPKGVVSYLPGIGADIGPALVQHPDVAMIAFTGSKPVGLLINRQAAELAEGQDHVKRVLAEMGGKNAIIVDSDADLDEAVHGVTSSAFGYAGQKCSACSRVVVLDALHDVFLARLVEATRSLRTGPAEDPGSFVGPLIDAKAKHRVLNYIEKGKSEAQLAYAADLGEWAGEGFFVGPHIFSGVAPGATIAQDEIFGPVLAVLRARDLDHALEIANGTPYALTGGFYSRSPQNIERVKRDFRVGNLYINRKITGALVDRQPFGGFKLSGIGAKAGGPDYLLQFVQPRAITENTLRRGFAPADEAETPGR